MTPAIITGCGLAVTGIADEHHLLDPARTATPDDDPGRPETGMRHKDRASRLALRATRLALRGITLPADTAVIVSSNLGNLDTVCDFVDTIDQETVTGLSPMRVPHMSSNVTACWLALDHGFHGPNITLCSGTTSGLDALFWATTLLSTRRAQAALVIGVEPDTPPAARLHTEHGARRQTEHGAQLRAAEGRAARLDGAVCLVVEPLARARALGARPRAELRAYGRAADQAEAIRRATRAWPGPIGLRLAGWSEPDATIATTVARATMATTAAGASTATKALTATTATMVTAATTVDLTARLGQCSGALGVLQCAAALSWLDRPGHDAVLAIAGDDGEHPDGEGDPSGVAALLLVRPSDNVASDEVTSESVTAGKVSSGEASLGYSGSGDSGSGGGRHDGA